jgi:hypothetical protein
MIAYRKRQNVFEKKEREWRVEPDALVFRDAEGRELREAWRDAVAVRLRYAPSRFKTWLYITEISFKSGRSWTIDNSHFAGFADFEDRTATYTPFVHAVLERLAANAPDIKAYSGTTMISYVAQIGIVAIAFAALAAVFLSIPVFESSDPWWLVAKLAIIAVMIPPFITWVRRNYPHTFSIHAVPDDAVPKPEPV